MTSFLQVMDLVVNGPIKSLSRQKRCVVLYDYFQQWKIAVLLELVKPIADRKSPPAFEPPAPTMIQGFASIR